MEVRYPWTPQGPFQAAGSQVVGLEPRSTVRAAVGRHLPAPTVVEVKTAGVGGVQGECEAQSSMVNRGKERVVETPLGGLAFPLSEFIHVKLADATCGDFSPDVVTPRV